VYSVQKWHYLTAGNPDESIVVFLHGFMGSSNDWKQVISFLKKDFYCIALDLPGHGKTPIKENLSFESVADTIIQFLDGLGIKKTHLVGYSMGGRLAMYLALEYSEFFDKVVLESASPGLKTEIERKQRIKRDEILAKKIADIPFKKFLEEWYRQPLFESLLRHPQYQDLLEERLKNTPGSLARALLTVSTGRQPNLWNRLEENKIPLLLLAGEFDIKFQKINQKMVKYSPLIRYQMIAGVGHNIHFENPLLFAKILKDFFKGDEVL